MQIVWREKNDLYDRFVSSMTLNKQGTARVCYEVYRTGTDEWVDGITIEASSLDRAYNLLATVLHDPSFRGWVGYSDNT